MRDFGIDISESSTGRIMTKLRFPRSRSELRCKKKRRFKEHYNEIGENVQIDYRTVTKNGIVMKHFAGIERLASTFMQTFTAKQIALMPLNFYEN